MSDGRVRGCVLLLALTGFLAGCSGGAVHFAGGQADTVPVSMSITDTPPTGVSVLSFQATLTDARLNPGNVELLAAPVTINLTRLQTETSLMSSVTVPPGTYTSVALTFADASPLTIENNSGGTLSDGVTNCLNGQVCTLSPAVSSLTGSVSLPGTGATLSGTTPAALLLDLNVANALVNAPPLEATLIANTTVSQLAPAPGAPFESLEDVVGVVTTPSNGAFVLQTALGNYNITTNSTTQYLNFPGAVCSPVGFSCVATSEIVSVNMSLQTTNTLVASDIFYEDDSTALPEVEGVVVATGGLPAQFSMVVLQETPSASGPAIGSDVEVAINNGTTFAIDNLVGTLNTSAFSFAGTTDMIVGQEVAVQQSSGSTASVIQAGRVLLRSSRITGTVATTAFPNFTVNGLPPFLQNASPAITQIKVETATEFTPNGTEYGGTAPVINDIADGHGISVRGQLFANSGNPALLASRVVQHN
jgi:hypothetical protein